MKTAESILPLVYEELRRLAKVRMTKEKPGQTLSATALVHEAYLLLTKKGDEPVWENKRHFFAAAATSMRRILRERALRKSRFRHGGNVRRVMFDNSSISINLEDEKWAGEFLDLDSALEDLKKERPAAASLVELRFFSGLSVPEAAEVMNVSERTANRCWAFAKAWLHSRLNCQFETSTKSSANDL